MRTYAAVLFFAFAIGLVFALGCSPIYLVALPDGGRQQVFPQPDGGIVIDFDGGTTSCLPNPSCIVTLSDGGIAGDCHAGYQECQADGTLGTCTPYGNCPAPASTCSGYTDILFILDDSATDVSAADFITAQSAIQLYVFENQQWNYLYGLQDVPGCGDGGWGPFDNQGLERASVFLPFISVQCVANAGPTSMQTAEANAITILNNMHQVQVSGKFIFIFQPGPQEFTQENLQGIQVITVGYGQLTIDEIFNLLTGAVVCG